MYAVFSFLIDGFTEDFYNNIHLNYLSSSMDNFNIPKLYSNLFSFYDEYFENQTPDFIDDEIQQTKIFICKFPDENLSISLFMNFKKLEKYCIYKGTFENFKKRFVINKKIKNKDTAKMVGNYLG